MTCDTNWQKKNIIFIKSGCTPCENCENGEMVKILKIDRAWGVGVYPYWKWWKCTHAGRRAVYLLTNIPQKALSNVANKINFLHCKSCFLKIGGKKNINNNHQLPTVNQLYLPYFNLFYIRFFLFLLWNYDSILILHVF